MKTKKRKMDNELYNANAQFSVLKAVSERIDALKKDTVNPEEAALEIDYLQAFCSGGFALSYLSVKDIAGDTEPVQARIGVLYDSYRELLDIVTDGYSPFVAEK
jgi:hypothetical protein